MSRFGRDYQGKRTSLQVFVYRSRHDFAADKDSWCGLLNLSPSDEGPSIIDVKEGLSAETRLGEAADSVSAKGTAKELAAKPLGPDNVVGSMAFRNLVLAAASDFSEEAVAALLSREFAEFRSAHEDCTNLSLTAYRSRAAFDADSFDWIGKVTWKAGMTAPRTRIEMGEKTRGIRFGYSLEQRKQMYWEKIEAEDRARRETDKLYGQLTIDRRWGAERDRRAAKYIEQVAQKWNVSVDDFDEITAPGSMQNWPSPALE